jgi:hypothetical protein
MHRTVMVASLQHRATADQARTAIAGNPGPEFPESREFSREFPKSPGAPAAPPSRIYATIPALESEFLPNRAGNFRAQNREFPRSEQGIFRAR